MTEAYIEWFLLDNVLMGCIILFCAEPFAMCRLSRPLALLVSLGSAAYAVLAMLEPVLLAFPFKAMLLAALVIPFRPRTWQKAARCGGCVLISTFIMGGVSYMAAEHIGAMNSRVLMVVAVLCMFLIRPIKSLLAKARLNQRDVMLKLTAPGIERTVSGRIDTGNTLKEPVTGLPVVVIYGDDTELAEYFSVPYCTIGGSGTMKGVKGRVALVEDTEGLGERDCCVAFSPTPMADCDAVINAELFAV